jgi:hypothetical protein
MSANPKNHDFGQKNGLAAHLLILAGSTVESI